LNLSAIQKNYEIRPKSQTMGATRERVKRGGLEVRKEGRLRILSGPSLVSGL